MKFEHDVEYMQASLLMLHRYPVPLFPVAVVLTPLSVTRCVVAETFRGDESCSGTKNFVKCPIYWKILE